MSINTGLYCLLNQSLTAVIEGPRQLPATWSPYRNFNNDDHTDDDTRRSAGWYPYAEEPDPDPGPPEPLPKRYHRRLSDFVIEATRVIRNISYEEFSTAEYDQTAPVTPIDWEQIPGDQRQFVNVPYETVSRLVIARIFQTWNTPDDIYALRATLYTTDDATGFSVKIHDDTTGNFLYTMPLLPPGDPGNPFRVEDRAWYAETPSGAWGQHLERKPWRYYIFKNVDLTPEMRLPFELEQTRHDVRWNQNGLIQSGVSGRRN